jgi:hypothetical protein
MPLATVAHAQADDKAYCAQLVDLYRRYVQNSPGRAFDVEASRALDDFRKGNPEGISRVGEEIAREQNNAAGRRRIQTIASRPSGRRSRDNAL